MNEHECPLPVCRNYAGSRRSDFTWFPGGPSLDQLPLPVADPDRLPGSQCSECSGYCHGHYLKPAESLQVGCFTPPPSSVISRAYKNAQSDITEFARVVMLPEEEVDIWLKHVQTVSDNRKRGASKAAETRCHKADVKDYLMECVEGIMKRRLKKQRTGLDVTSVTHGFTGFVLTFILNQLHFYVLTEN